MVENDSSQVLSPFFCQLDNEKHPSTEDRYQCLECGRLICSSCYETQQMVGLTNCPFCEGHLKFQKSLGSIKGQITPPTSVNDLSNTKDVSAAKTLFDKGRQFESMLKYEEAFLSYSQALDLNPSDVNLWCAKGKILENINKNMEALDCYKKGLDLFPHDETLLSRTGFTLGTLNRHEEALKYYQKALAINSKNGDTWNNKGATLGTLGRYDEALECYDKAIRLNSADIEAWFNRGMILEIKKYYRAALESFIKVTELDSSDSEALTKVESLSKKVK